MWWSCAAWTLLLVFTKFIGLNWKPFLTTSLTHVHKISLQLHERKSKTLRSQTKDHFSIYPDPMWIIPMICKIWSHMCFYHPSVTQCCYILQQMNTAPVVCLGKLPKWAFHFILNALMVTFRFSGQPCFWHSSTSSSWARWWCRIPLAPPSATNASV